MLAILNVGLFIDFARCDIIPFVIAFEKLINLDEKIEAAGGYL